jgi:hypothetical protein
MASKTETPASQQKLSAITANPNDLSDVEKRNIKFFAGLMEKMDSDTSGKSSAGILEDKELRSSYDSLTALHPKLVKNIEDCVEKHRVFMDLHEKLIQGVRIYDRLTEERMAQEYKQKQQLHGGFVPPYAQQPYAPPQAYGHQYAPPPQQQQQGYPPSQSPYQQHHFVPGNPVPPPGVAPPSQTGYTYGPPGSSQFSQPPPEGYSYSYPPVSQTQAHPTYPANAQQNQQPYQAYPPSTYNATQGQPYPPVQSNASPQKENGSKVPEKPLIEF